MFDMSKSMLFVEPKDHFLFTNEKGQEAHSVALNFAEMALVVPGVVTRFRIKPGLPSRGTAVLVQVGLADEGVADRLYEEFVNRAKEANPDEDVPTIEDLLEWDFCVPAGIKYRIEEDADGSQWVEVEDCQYFTDPCEVDEKGVMHPME